MPFFLNLYFTELLGRTPTIQQAPQNAPAADSGRGPIMPFNGFQALGFLHEIQSIKLRASGSARNKAVAELATLFRRVCNTVVEAPAKATNEPATIILRSNWSSARNRIGVAIQLAGSDSPGEEPLGALAVLATLSSNFRYSHIGVGLEAVISYEEPSPSRFESTAGINCLLESRDIGAVGERYLIQSNQQARLNRMPEALLREFSAVYGHSQLPALLNDSATELTGWPQSLPSIRIGPAEKSLASNFDASSLNQAGSALLNYFRTMDSSR